MYTDRHKQVIRPPSLLLLLRLQLLLHNVLTYSTGVVVVHLSVEEEAVTGGAALLETSSCYITLFETTQRTSDEMLMMIDQ